MHLFYMLIIIYAICVPDRSVWVSDSQRPFVEHPGMSPDVLYMKEKQPLHIPCRVTHPNATTTLVKVSAGNVTISLHGLGTDTCSASWSLSVIRVSTHVTLCPSLPNHTTLILCTSPTLVPFFSIRAHICAQSTVPLFLPLQIIHHIVLILAAITLWRVCPFVCVCLRICVKVCADMFVSVGAWVLSEGASGQCYKVQQRGAFRVPVACMCVCFCISACCCMDFPVNETKPHLSA